jgi:hypothetical protein
MSKDGSQAQRGQTVVRILAFFLDLIVLAILPKEALAGLASGVGQPQSKPKGNAEADLHQRALQRAVEQRIGLAEPQSRTKGTASHSCAG